MSNKLMNGQLSRDQVFQACEALGIDPHQVRSIYIEHDHVELELFELNDEGRRFFANPDKPEDGYKKYRTTLKVI